MAYLQVHVAGNCYGGNETTLAAGMKSDIENVIFSLDSSIYFKIHSCSVELVERLD